MSGGRFNYINDTLGYELFNQGCDYGKDGRALSKTARRYNPMEDYVVSEIVWDALCLIHSLDWYLSGDTSEDTYLEDVKAFKKKWLTKKGLDSHLKDMIDDVFEDTKNDLYKSFGIECQEDKDNLGGHS